MGNKGVKAKLDRSNSKFLGNGEEKVYLQNFFNSEMQGTPSEKFKILSELVDEYDEICDLISLPTTHEEMNTQGGFFDKLSDEQAKQIYEALKALQEKQ